MVGAIIAIMMMVGFPGAVINQVNGVDLADSVKNPAIVQRYEFNE